MLKVENVSKQFPGVQALRSVSVEVKLGRVHALVGENGAGKSTLVKIISGAQRPDSGRIIFNGVVFEEYSPPRTGSPWSISVSNWCRCFRWQRTFCSDNSRVAPDS